MLNLTPEIISKYVLLIQVVAGIVGWLSLAHSEPLLSVESKRITLAIIAVIIVAFVVPLGFYVLGWFIGTTFLRLVAGLDLFLLFFLLTLTGGPTQSWFTPFLLAITPLGMVLDGNTNIRWGWSYLGGTILVFALQLDIFRPLYVPATPLNLNANNTTMYHVWYFISTSVAVFFPAMIALKIAKWLPF